MTCLLWQNVSTREFAHFDGNSTVAIFPVGATEQHGPHLPLGVDSIIVDGIIKTAAPLFPENFHTLIMPTAFVGKSNEHMNYPGTLSLSFDTLVNMWLEIGECVYRSGIQKLLILNGHGGQTNISQIVARDLRIKHGMLTVAANWWSLGQKREEFSEEEYRFGLHGGAEETSAIMYLNPELIFKEHLDNFISKSES